MSFYKKNMKYFLITSAWTIFLGIGFSRLFLYSNTPGVPARPLDQWPAASKIIRNQKESTLLVFAHPHCPCSEATIGELERLVPHIQKQVKSFVIFFKPKKKSMEWAKDKLWIKAENIPTVETILDEDGVEAGYFGARTSGQTFLFDTNGKLIFQGGITPERGHMGDSDGRSAILSFISTGNSKIQRTSVFGCSLKNPERAIAGKSNE